MKFFAALLLNILLSYAIGLFTFLPWYSFVFVVFLVSLLVHQKPLMSFVTGFLAVCIVWVVLAILADSANNHILSTKVATILPLKGSYTMLTLITGVVGGLVAGFAALTGSLARKLK
jgi:hypothetical protein